MGDRLLSEVNTTGVRYTIAGEADMPDIFALRHRVYTLEQGVDPALDRDATDDMAIHVVARDDEGRCLGTARLFNADGQWVLGRMVVAESARRGGVGAGIVRTVERLAADRGAHSIHLHAQDQASGFYGRLGYEQFGGGDMDAGIPHHWMRRTL